MPVLIAIYHAHHAMKGQSTMPHTDRPSAIKREIVDRLTAAGIPADTRIDLDKVADEVLTGPEHGHVLAVTLAEFWSIAHRHLHIPATPDRSLDLARYNLERTAERN